MMRLFLNWPLIQFARRQVNHQSSVDMPTSHVTQ